MNGFGAGLAVWARGWGFILRHRSLLALALAPLVLSAGLVVAAAFLAMKYIYPWLGFATLYFSRDWLRDLTFLSLFSVTVVLIAIISVYALLWMHLLLTAPFYALMAERAFKLAGRKPIRDVSIARLIWIGLLKTALLAFASGVLFVFSFLPGVGAVVSIAGALILAFNMIDYAFEAAGLTLGERLAYLGRERGQWLGVTAALALTLLLPGLTLLVAPGAVVGGALILNLEHREEDHGPRTPAS